MCSFYMSSVFWLFIFILASLFTSSFLFHSFCVLGICLHDCVYSYKFVSFPRFLSLWHVSLCLLKILFLYNAFLAYVSFLFMILVSCHHCLFVKKSISFSGILCGILQYSFSSIYIILFHVSFTVLVYSCINFFFFHVWYIFILVTLRKCCFFFMSVFMSSSF